LVQCSIKKIRKTLFLNEWWFSVIDVIEALTNSDRPSVYWTAMKARIKNEEDFQPSTICRQLKLQAEDGKMRKTDCASTKCLNYFLRQAKCLCSILLS